MAVRNQNCRQSKNYIFVEFENQKYMICLGDFQTKNILYSTKKKLLSKNLDLPKFDNLQNKTILITVELGKNPIYQLI